MGTDTIDYAAPVPLHVTPEDFRAPSVSSVAATPLRQGQTPEPPAYSDDVFHFRVPYPTDYAVREYVEDEDGARTVAFEGPRSGGISDFRRSLRARSLPNASKAMIRLAMNDAEEIMVDGTPAKSFIGYNDQMGATREVWFIHGGYLYEITTYRFRRSAHRGPAELEISIASVCEKRSDGGGFYAMRLQRA
jgi:hypothetical protein